MWRKHISCEPRGPISEASRGPRAGFRLGPGHWRGYLARGGYRAVFRGDHERWSGLVTASRFQASRASRRTPLSVKDEVMVTSLFNGLGAVAYPP